MEEVTLSFGKLCFDSNIVISEINSGVDLDQTKIDMMIDLFNYQFKDQPFAYISNRIHDYSLNPAESKRIIDSTSIVCAAFVLKRKISYSSFESERIFYRIPIQAFTEIDTAITWAQDQLQKLDALEDDSNSNLAFPNNGIE